MPKLNDRKWKKFKAFGEDGLFSIATTSSSVDSIRLIASDNEGFPYVTRSDKNNGIARFVAEENKGAYGYDRAGTITIGLDTQTAFWQPCDYVTGQNIQVISSERLNRHIAQFLIPLFKKQMNAKFNWGGNGATLTRMKTLEILLPIDSSGEPDWNFMEDYIREREAIQLSRLKTFLNKQIAEIERERE